MPSSSATAGTIQTGEIRLRSLTLALLASAISGFLLIPDQPRSNDWAASIVTTTITPNAIAAGPGRISSRPPI